MVSAKYGNFSAYSRTFAPANLPSVPGSGNSLYPRVDAVRTRAVRDAYAFRARLPKGYTPRVANYNRPVRPIPRDLWKGYDWTRPVAAGVRDEFGSLWGAGVSRALSSPNMLAAEVQAALAHSVWEMYFPADTSWMVHPALSWDGTKWNITAGSISVQQSWPSDPGDLGYNSTTLDASNTVPYGENALADGQFFVVRGLTAADRVKINSFTRRNYWNFNIPSSLSGLSRHSLFYPAVAMGVQSKPVVVAHGVDLPNLSLGSRWSGLDIYGGKPVAVAEPAPRYEPRNEKGKYRSPIYRIFKALEEAGDVGTLLAAFYRAARRQLLEETGRKTVSWEKATWRQRLYVIEWGLTHGVDYAGLAADVGMWWVGERIGAVLGPTVVAPGDRVSSNIRHHNIQSAFSDLI